MKLSVIIPTLNESEYLRATVLSAREKSVLGKPHEFIVVDSGSTDGTVAIAQELGVSLISFKPKMLGRAHALNKGASYATGDVFFSSMLIPFLPWVTTRRFKPLWNPQI